QDHVIQTLVSRAGHLGVLTHDVEILFKRANPVLATKLLAILSLRHQRNDFASSAHTCHPFWSRASDGSHGSHGCKRFQGLECARVETGLPTRGEIGTTLLGGIRFLSEPIGGSRARSVLRAHARACKSAAKDYRLDQAGVAG